MKRGIGASATHAPRPLPYDWQLPWLERQPNTRSQRVGVVGALPLGQAGRAGRRTVRTLGSVESVTCKQPAAHEIEVRIRGEPPGEPEIPLGPGPGRGIAMAAQAPERSGETRGKCPEKARSRSGHALVASWSSTGSCGLSMTTSTPGRRFPSSLAPVSACSLSGAFYATTFEWGGQATSSHLSSGIVIACLGREQVIDRDFAGRRGLHSPPSPTTM